MRGDNPDDDCQQAQDHLALSALRQYWTVQATEAGCWLFTNNGRDWITSPLESRVDIFHVLEDMSKFGFSLESPKGAPIMEELGELALDAVRQGWAVRQHKGADKDLWSFRRNSSTEINRRVEGKTDLRQLRAILEAAGLTPAVEVVDWRAHLRPVGPAQGARTRPGSRQARNRPGGPSVNRRLRMPQWSVTISAPAPPGLTPETQALVSTQLPGTITHEHDAGRVRARMSVEADDAETAEVTGARRLAHAGHATGIALTGATATAVPLDLTAVARLPALLRTALETGNAPAGAAIFHPQ